MPQRAHRPFVRARALLAATLVLVLAACASAPPAPIVARTTPGARPAAPTAAPAAPVAAPAPTPTPPAPDATVQTAPIRSGSVESRGIESRPLEPRPAAVAPAPAVTPAPGAPPAPALPPNTRSTPRGTKLPYSESALAELRAAEAAAPPAAASAPASPTPAATPAAPTATAPAAAGAAGPAAPAAPAAIAAPPAVAAAAAPDGEGEWAWPSPGKVMQSFSESGNKGVVLGGKVGEPVVAAADGRVIFSGNGPRGYGNLVIVKHANELLSVYAHNRTLSVKEGQSVKRGQKIAELGDSGTTSPRLHFEIRQQGKPVDPTRFLPKR
ncbi:MAG: peptidoglycan DD-metalloendopeptidase family protein [Burkholderiales bacterium]|nr:peptidoglycan DD-metalloendopeptidase family protein [Burkholderiales bacterium]